MRYTHWVVETLQKKFRVSDRALVVYQDAEIHGVRYADGSPWIIWNVELHRWEKASPRQAKSFEDLPLAGSIDG